MASDKYYYNNINISNIIKTDATSTDFTNNVLDYYTDFPKSKISTTDQGSLSNPSALNYKVPTGDVAKYCTNINYQYTNGVKISPPKSVLELTGSTGLTKAKVVVIGGGGGGGGGALRGDRGDIFIYAGRGGGGGGMVIADILDPKYIYLESGIGGSGGRGYSDAGPGTAGAYGPGKSGFAGGYSAVINYSDSNANNVICSIYAYGGNGGAGGTQSYDNSDEYPLLGGSAGDTNVSGNCTYSTTDYNQGASASNTPYNGTSYEPTTPGGSGGNGPTYQSKTGYYIPYSIGATGGTFDYSHSQGYDAGTSGYGVGGGGAGANSAGTYGGNGGPGAVFIYFYV